MVLGMNVEVNTVGFPVFSNIMGLGLLELVVAFGILLWLSTRGRHTAGPRFLGVCWRLARQRRVSVGQVRLLAAIAIILSGIVPGLLVYVLLGVFMEQWAGPDDADTQPLPPLACGDFPRHPSPVVPPSAGPSRIGRYVITGTLGRGGMGTVYRGRDEALHRDVAIKVIHDRFGGVENVLRRFAAEARAVAQLSSPHIVQVYEFDPLAEPPFLAMELVPGPSIQALVRRRGKAAVGTVADCGRQVLRGLAAAHAAGIIHRDVKPGNILRADDGTYKLGDFGLARSLEQGQSLTASGSVIGTLHYMAPEVAAGEEATASSDLYSLGVTLYEMLAGTTPFPDDSPLKLLRRIAAEPPAPIRAHRDDVPPRFEAWLQKLLARDPGHRFSSAAAALEALADVEAGGPEAGDFAFETVEVATGMDRLRPLHATTARRWAPAEPAPRPVPAADVQSIIRRAMQLEEQGRDMLGHDTVLDIARELNVESTFVREALRRHRDTRGMPPLPVGQPQPVFPAELRAVHAAELRKLWWANFIDILGFDIPIIDLPICEFIGVGMMRPVLKGPLAAASDRFRDAGAFVTPTLIACLVLWLGNLVHGSIAVLTLPVLVVLATMLWWKQLSGAADLCIAWGRPDTARSVRRSRNWGLVLLPVVLVGGLFLAAAVSTNSSTRYETSESSIGASQNGVVVRTTTSRGRPTVVATPLAGLAVLPVAWFYGWLFTLRPLAAASRAVEHGARRRDEPHEAGVRW
jgi:hypothetical protein